ncbi:hypothetical protein C8F04DRAFT_946358 [Mycena alexandri]|uniref:Uncharacterized protein n=1 Tax=Mycena alexandri TaxID=1745969 RepID=A0AAD6T9M8_9AGAR|nr:hypothetical protein C8F04DRAFT_946358 [Mycena alexandri]
MSSIHAVRAKKWETNAFIAEWFQNAVNFCQSKEGKKQFEAWLVEEYGKEEAKQKLLDCQKPSRKIYGLPVFGNLKLINSAAVEFGISNEAMQEYHSFTAGSNLCAPPRTKPAPKRRRGETSTEWLARRHDALLTGCKIPDIDWRIARAMAISEFEKARDTFEMWRTDIMMFLHQMLARAPTTLITTDIKIGTPEERFSRLEYAFTSSLHGVTLSYMTWGHAVDVFEELDRRGLTTTSAIERAYQQDPALMWRLVACLCKISYLAGHLWERASEVISWCEYYRPFFKRYRTLSGKSRIEIDRTYVRRREGSVTSLDYVIMQGIPTDAGGHPAFFDNFLKCLNKDPSEAAKFSDAAYQEIGDLAIVNEFKAQIYDSAFGQRLIRLAESNDSQCLKDPSFLPNTTFMDPSKISWLERNSNDWSYARTISRSIGKTWIAITSEMRMHPFFACCIPWPSSPEREKLPLIYDNMWGTIDIALWEFAKNLDRKGELGIVARNFGLFNPTDPERPSCMSAIMKQVGAHLSERLRLRSQPQPMPPSTPEKLPAPSTVPTAGVSGYAYLSDTQHLRAKEKVKTKGAALPKVAAGGASGGDAGEEEEQDEEEEQLLDVLPKDFKIGKKLLKVFHRILQAPDLPGNHDDQGPRMGQIRWAEFERAMKRIGFGIVQTAGSSVRFDPPAKSAHPITFHRPHPDAILTPIMLRW